MRRSVLRAVERGYVRFILYPVPDIPESGQLSSFPATSVSSESSRQFSKDIPNDIQFKSVEWWVSVGAPVEEVEGSAVEGRDEYRERVGLCG